MKRNEILDYGKIPPQAIEAEEAVLGALLLESEALQTISGIIDKTMFYKPEHTKLYEVINEVAKTTPVDLITVTVELRNCGLLDGLGGPGFLMGLTKKIVSAAHLEFHARIIAESYYKRETIRKATGIIQMAYAGIDVEAIGNEWRQTGESLEDIFSVANSGTHIREVIKTTLELIEQDALLAKTDKTPGIPTGLNSLDINTGGWRNGNLLVLAARPGIRKTSLALFFALQAAKAGYWVNIFSAEMLKEDLMRIILAAESGIYRSNLRDGIMEADDWRQLNKSVAALEKLPIIFRDAAGMTVEQIKATIRKNRKNGRCDFAIVDYLQLVKTSQSKMNRELEVSEISRSLKTTALAENIPIMALSQLNRAADGETLKLSHLRESGAIEQDADLVCLLSKPDSEQNIIRLNVAKHRRGKLEYCTSNTFHGVT